MGRAFAIGVALLTALGNAGCLLMGGGYPSDPERRIMVLMNQSEGSGPTDHNGLGDDNNEPVRSSTPPERVHGGVGQ